MPWLEAHKFVQGRDRPLRAVRADCADHFINLFDRNWRFRFLQHRLLRLFGNYRAQNPQRSELRIIESEVKQN